MVKSPYNFVPLAEKVFFPGWASLISQDVPFSDGESGIIQLSIKAHSDIFVSESVGKKEQADTNRVKGFSKDADNKYFIPGSSLKGTVRSVLQILSDGKVGPMEDTRYAIRDLRNAQGYIEKLTWKDIRCGWLRKDKDDKLLLQDCGIPGRISHHQLDAYFKTRFFEYFRGESVDNKRWQGNNDAFKAAKHKIDLLTQRQADAFTQTYAFSEVRGATAHDHRTYYDFDGHGESKGWIVCTGQPSKRQEKYDVFLNDPRHPLQQMPKRTPEQIAKWITAVEDFAQQNNHAQQLKNTQGKGKHSEFIFWDQEAKEEELPAEVFQDFQFVYFESDKEKQSVDYKYWMQRLDTKGDRIPVFFYREGGNDHGKVMHMGLSFMYKLPYDQRVKDLLPEEHKSERRDLAECIFGYAEEKGNGKQKKLDALKGRVQFGHAYATDAKISTKEISAILGTPRASYYPFYVVQEQHGQLKDYHNGQRIRGYKRYPFHTGTQTNDQGNANDRIKTKFKPLAAGSTFNTEIRFHNLRPIELGALLSALTFHHQEGQYYHGVGMGKPLGFGRCSFEVTLNGCKYTALAYMKAFEECMCRQSVKWRDSATVRELLAMAQAPVAHVQDTLVYPSIQPTNEFTDYKAPQGNPPVDKRFKAFSQLSGTVACTLPALPGPAAPQDGDTSQETAVPKAEGLIDTDVFGLLGEAYKAKTKKDIQDIYTQWLDDLRKKIAPPIIYDLSGCNNWEKVKKVTEVYLKKKKLEALPEADHYILETKVVTELMKNRPQDFKADFGKGAWFHLPRWLGEDKARNWFQQN